MIFMKEMKNKNTSEYKKVLILYFSMTKQCEKAAEAIADGLRKENRGVVLKKVVPVKEYIFPFKSKLDFFRYSMDSLPWKKIDIKPLDVDTGGFDLIIIGTPTWWLSPSPPIYALLSKENRIYFEGKKVAVFISCRAMWRRDLKIITDRLKSLGAYFIDVIALQHQGKEPKRIISLFAYLFTGEEFKPDFLRGMLYPYGLGEGELEKAEQFGLKMGKLLNK
ncbi:MAG: hypothetical protein A7316_00525 [Candidatus Altiarchaeales archaeon WOR_SM1_86-2]|nr:MAG: hypothetical protein A7316_00525 [Candidatus Altiarchaeales archaeon WOR_SM1_86-2]